MESMELPLVIFTILGQMSVGAFVILWLRDFLTKDAMEQKEISLQRTISFTLVILMGIGILSSMLHLGHPEHAYRALIHFKTSPLSREIWVTASFFWLLVAYTYFSWIEAEVGEIRRLIGLAAIAIGILAVIVSSLAYMLPARGAWNHFTTMGSFFCTAFLLGVFLVSAITIYKDREPLKNRYLYLILTVIILQAIIMLIHRNYLFNFSPETQETANLLYTKLAILFWLRVIIGLIVPFLLTLNIIRLKAHNNLTINILTYTGFGCVLIGESLSRILFFVTVVPLDVGVAL
jgi:anaerobic dimethyl sulfoxide reductase subunit C (anchor subunit)